MAFRKIEAGLVHADVDQFIGKTGTIFYDNSLGDFRISDGATPGGIALSFGGGDGGTYTLPTATTTVKGGVKIDGSTIVIANQVISVGTLPYTKLSGTPTIPTNNNQLTNGAAYITSAALSGLATETYVTTRGYITTSALTDYALTSAVPTNNNQLSNGAGYITSSSLTGLATETYVTTRGYITSAALSTYALTSSVPTDINQLTDVSGLLGGGGGGGTTYITNNVENPYSFSIAGDDSTLREIANGESIKITGAGGITVTTDAEGNLTVTGTPVSLAGYATESYVTSRGYITGLSYNDLTDKPNLAGTYTFNVAADDSTMREISSEETVKFVGAGGITTASDAEGKITITQGTTSSLVNGANTVSLGSTGILTFPNGALTVTGNKIRNVNESVGLITGSEIEVTVAKTVISRLTDTEGLSNQHIFEVGSTRIFSAYQVINTLGDGEGGPSLTGQQLTELTSTGFQIGQRVINDPGGESEPLTSFSGWTFGTVGQSQAITFPDSTVQSTAWTGSVAYSAVTGTPTLFSGSYNDLTNKPNLAGTYSWSIAADDSTLREILANESVKFIGAGSITTASDAEGNITITGAAPDRLTSNSRSAVLNTNGTFSLPTLIAAPSTPQAGQMALADGVSWDPIAQNNGAPYMVIYTGTTWLGLGGTGSGVTVDQVYNMILEMG